MTFGAALHLWGLLPLPPLAWAVAVAVRRFYWLAVVWAAAGGTNGGAVRAIATAVATVVCVAVVPLLYAPQWLRDTDVWSNARLACALMQLVDDGGGLVAAAQGALTVLAACFLVLMLRGDAAAFAAWRQSCAALPHAPLLIGGLQVAAAATWTLQALAIPVAAAWAYRSEGARAWHVAACALEFLTTSILPLVAVQCLVLCNNHARDMESQVLRAAHHVQLLEAAAASRRTLVSYLAHELRSSLQALRFGVAELADDGAHGATLRVMSGAVNTMGTLVDSMLAVDKLEAGAFALELQPMRLRDMVDSAAASAALRSRHERVTFTCSVAPDVPNLVTGDPHHLARRY